MRREIRIELRRHKFIVLLALLGSLFGLFYTAVVVSQFVGLARSDRRDNPGRP